MVSSRPEGLDALQVVYTRAVKAGLLVQCQEITFVRNGYDFAEARCSIVNRSGGKP